jgi:3-phenylpropionate/cinnamic acid dioxygenase small subunit
MDGDDAAAVRRLIDKDQIIDLVHRYSYCVDHRLYDEVVELFTEDCVVDYGPGWPPVRSRAGLRRMFAHPEGGFAATSHHNANVLVTFEDLDHASVRASVYAWHQRADGVTPRLWGYYHDSVVRLPDGWRIAELQLRTLGSEDWNVVMHSALEGEAPEAATP